MSDFFYQLVNDSHQYDDTETMEHMYSLQLDDMRVWCISQLDDIVSNDFLRNAIVADVDLYKLWRHMQDVCSPDPEE
jgi:hypothetical protein